MSTTAKTPHTDSEIAAAAASSLVDNTPYDAGTWDAAIALAPSKNAVRDKIEAMVTAYTALVSNAAYDAATWNGVTDKAPSKDAVRDKFEAILGDLTYLGASIDSLTDLTINLGSGATGGPIDIDVVGGARIRLTVSGGVVTQFEDVTP